MLSRLPIVLVVCVSLTGCFTGQRATLTTAPPGGNQGSPVGDANADAVLVLLESTATTASTATYSILHRFGGQTATGVVAHDASGKKSVTVNDVRYLLVGSPQTCSLSTRQCDTGVIEQRVSDFGISSTFADNAPARRLRVSIRRKNASTTASHRQLAGQDATCVTVPVGDGQETYCAVAGGHLAYLDASDVQVQLVTLTATADTSAFTA